MWKIVLPFLPLCSFSSTGFLNVAIPSLYVEEHTLTRVQRRFLLLRQSSKKAALVETEKYGSSMVEQSGRS